MTAETVDELDEANNVAVAVLSAMPAPGFLVASSSAEGDGIVLAWPTLETEAVAAYRVHRAQQPGGPYTRNR